jgi:hypothetical protein
MRQHLNVVFEVPEALRQSTRLDLVVPFTTPDLTQAALDAATGFGKQPDAVVRLVKIRLIPYPPDLSSSPVPVQFLEEQLKSLSSGLPTDCEIRFARDAEQVLVGAPHEDSVVIPATRRRLWRTHTERLAAKLRKAGYRVPMVSTDSSKTTERKDNA